MFHTTGADDPKLAEAIASLTPPKPCPYGTCPPSGCQVGTASGCCGPVGVDGEDGEDGPPGFLAGLQEGLKLFTEEECEPTTQSRRPVSLAEVMHKPNEEVIGLLERMLSYAHAGELIGLVAFGNHVGKNTMSAQAGDTEFAPMLAAFEDWKFRRAWERNIENGPDDQ